jgi:hypothetical protein
LERSRCDEASATGVCYRFFLPSAPKKTSFNKSKRRNCGFVARLMIGSQPTTVQAKGLVESLDVEVEVVPALWQRSSSTATVLYYPPPLNKR